MNCFNCPHYKSGYMSNSCGVTQSENFYTQDDCNLVNDDGSLNYDNEYIKMEYGDTEVEK